MADLSSFIYLGFARICAPSDFFQVMHVGSLAPAIEPACTSTSLHSCIYEIFLGGV